MSGSLCESTPAPVSALYPGKAMHKASFDPELFTYDAPDEHKYIYTMRMHPAPRDLRLGLDPMDQDSLPEVLQYDAPHVEEVLGGTTCFLRLNNSDTVRFFQTWEEKNLDAYVRHVRALGGWDAAHFESEYRRMLTHDSDGAPQLRLTIDLPSKRTHGTTVFEALPGEERGQFRLTSGTHESVKVGSRLMVRASAWYLGVNKWGYPSCKLHATEVVVFPAKPVCAAASVFTLPEGVSFLTE